MWLPLYQLGLSAVHSFDHATIARGCLTSIRGVPCAGNGTWGTYRAARLLDYFDSFFGASGAWVRGPETAACGSESDFLASLLRKNEGLSVLDKVLQVCPLAAVAAYVWAAAALEEPRLILRGLALLPYAQRAQGVRNSSASRSSWARAWARAAWRFWPRLAATQPGRAAAAAVAAAVPGCSGAGLASLDWAQLLALDGSAVERGCQAAGAVDVVPAAAAAELRADSLLFRSRVESRPRLPMAFAHSHEYVLKKPVAVWGLWLEFGVAAGDSLVKLAACVAPSPVYGFDWFHGIPEDWAMLGAGSYSTSGAPPAGLPPNAHIVNGLINQTLPHFVSGLRAAAAALQQPVPRVQVLSLDCDLYLCHAEVFTALQDFLGEGSILIFDDALNFPGYEDEALKAFFEMLRRRPRAFRVLAAPWEVLWTIRGERWLSLFQGVYGQRFLIVELLE